MLATTLWKFYTDADQFWSEMLFDIENTKRTVDIEQYIFSLDKVGLKFISLLKRKAEEGVRVRLLCDASGSAAFFNSGYADDLRRKGFEIIFYNPISLWRLHNFTSWFFRDHRKITVVDSEIGYTGSLGIKSAMRHWRETSIRLQGPVVAEMEDAFEQMWKAAAANKKIYSIKRFRHTDLEFRFLTNSAYLRNRFIRKSVIEAIRSARQYVYLSTPYFVPDLGFFRALRLAARRKVDVRLLVPASSDHKTIHVAAASYFGLAFKSGIKVYRYQKKFLHAKTAVIDDAWATVGSANFDNLSFRYSYEGNIISINKQFTRELKSHFLADLADSEELKPSVWAKRPFLEKVLEVLSWPMHNFF